MAILLKKAEISNIELDLESAELIASRMQTNVRELEGALKLVSLHAKCHHKNISPAIVYEALQKHFEQKSRTLSYENILRIVAEYYKLRLSDVISPSRLKDIVRARQVAIFVIHQSTKLSLKEIGSIFGGKDHTTIMHSIAKIKKLQSIESEIAIDIKNIQRRLHT